MCLYMCACMGIYMYIYTCIIVCMLGDPALWTLYSGFFILLDPVALSMLTNVA